MNRFETLRQVELRTDKHVFHREVFDYLLALWEGHVPPPDEAEAGALLPLMARWLRAAPLREPQDRFRLLTARRGLLCLVHASGTSVDGFLESALGLLPPLEKAAPWVRQKLALMASIDSQWHADLDAWQRISPDEAMLYAIAALCDEPISATGLDNFNAVVAALPELKPVDLPYSHLTDLAYANYIVSFASAAQKYAGKRVFGEQVRRMLDRRGFLAEMPDRENRARQGRPQVTVIAERLVGGNMVHRCYGRQITELKRDFDVTLIAEAPSRCEAHHELAHVVRYFDPHPEKLGELIKSVLNGSPDLIYYPSVGMTTWTFALPHLRLAPLQVACLGHPSPTVSRVLDYLAMPGDVWSPAAENHEAPLLYESHALTADFSFSAAVDELHEAWAGRAARQRIRIAINASSMKLNAGFLACIREIVRQRADRVELRFFPSGVGVRHQALVKRLQAWFPEAEVMPGTDFDRYIELLADCDLALQAFPFGGTNTTMDVLALGLPIVCLDGPELHSRIDAAILNRAGLHSTLLAGTTEAYQALAWRLIDDAGERVRIGRIARQRILAILRERPDGSTLADVLKPLLDARTAPES